MKHSLPVKDTVIIGFMLFALFRGRKYDISAGARASGGA